LYQQIEYLCCQIKTITSWLSFRRDYFETEEYVRPSYTELWTVDEWKQWRDLFINTESSIYNQYDSQILQRIVDYVIVPTRGDGNCFLYSAFQISTSAESQHHQWIQECMTYIRKQVSLFIQTNKSAFTTPLMWRGRVVVDMSYLKSEAKQTLCELNMNHDCWNFIEKSLFLTTHDSQHDVNLSSEEKEHIVQLFSHIIFKYTHLYVDNTFIWAFASWSKHVVIVLAKDNPKRSPLPLSSISSLPPLSLAVSATDKALLYTTYKIREVYPNRTFLDHGWPFIYVVLNPDNVHYSILSPTLEPESFVYSKTNLADQMSEFLPDMFL
jgi:hypothetical protein